MALTILELFSSDTIEDLKVKVNKNFDQLILAGGGNVGPTGPIGVGIAGPQGRRGENFYFDDGTGIGSAPLLNNIIGDEFVLLNGDVYEWDGLTWVLTAVNLQGPVGPTGPSGASTDLLRWGGGFGSSFGVSTSFYPQIPSILTATPLKSDYISLTRGGLDVFYLGDAESAYGNLGPNSGISNWPLEANIGKLWVVQNNLVGGGRNGIVLGSVGAKLSTDAVSIVGNYDQFGYFYLGTDGSMNLQITAGGVSSEPKPINLLSDDNINLIGGDVINNKLSIGKDPFDSLIGLYGTFNDKIDLFSENGIIKTNNSFSFEVDKDLDEIGYFKIKKDTIGLSSALVTEKTLSIQLGSLAISTNSGVYSDGLSINSGSKTAKIEIMNLASINLLTLGSYSGSSNDLKTLNISSDNKVFVSPNMGNGWFNWMNDSINLSLPSGSLSVYSKIRMKNTGYSPLGGIVYGDTDGVFGYANENGIPGNSTNFALGLWSRDVANNKLYPTVSTDYINLGGSSTDNGSMLHLKTGSRNAIMTLEGLNVSDVPEIRIVNGFKSTIKTTNTVSFDRNYIIPRSAGRGGYFASFTDNNGQFDDNWEEYQKLTAPLAPLGSLYLKNQIGLYSIGCRNTLIPGFITDTPTLNEFIVSGGAENVTYGSGYSIESRYPSKVHLKRINNDFWILSFSICLYINPNNYTAMTLTNFNFFEFVFINNTKPGIIKPFRDSTSVQDISGGTWYKGSAYHTGVKTVAAGIALPTINTETRRGLVTDYSTYVKNVVQFDIGNDYNMQWTTERISHNSFRIQIMTSDITKQNLRNGIMFTGHAIMYGFREADTMAAAANDVIGITPLSIENP